MTTTYVPTHPEYLDEADVRSELTRVFDICGACRACVDLCMSFPTLFDMLDQHGGQPDRPDAGRLTPADQDRVVDQCVQCTSCYVRCPYTPELHEWAVDVPRLMLRATAMQHEVGIRSMRSRLRARLRGRPKLLARLAIVMPGTAERIAGAPFAEQRFSTWFSDRAPAPPSRSTSGRRGSVTVFPTCRVEYHDPAFGIDLVERCDADGIGCAITDAGCCGAPSLIAGDIDRFGRVAARNVATLSAEVRRGTDIVVSEASCRSIVRTAYVDHVGGPDAELVALHTFAPSEYFANRRDE